MKFGLIVSGTFHFLVITLGLLNFSSPRPLQVASVESLSIEIVPLADITRTITGDEESSEPPATIPTPKPTTEPALESPGENIGDADSDHESDSNEINNTTNDDSSIASLLTQLPPEPESQAEVADESTDTPPPLPRKVATPRPRPPTPTPTPDTPNTENLEQIAALLDRAKESRGGTKRSDTQEAGLGVRRGNNATTLSRSQLDELRSKIEKCWNIGALVGSDDANTLGATVEFRLNRDGTIASSPSVEAFGGSAHSQRAFAGGAKRAIVRCAPYELPPEKYEEWADVTVHFSLKDML